MALGQVQSLGFRNSQVGSRKFAAGAERELVWLPRARSKTPPLQTGALAQQQNKAPARAHAAKGKAPHTGSQKKWPSRNNKKQTLQQKNADKGCGALSCCRYMPRSLTCCPPPQSTHSKKIPTTNKATLAV